MLNPSWVNGAIHSRCSPWIENAFKIVIKQSDRISVVKFCSKKIFQSIYQLSRIIRTVLKKRK